MREYGEYIEAEPPPHAADQQHLDFSKIESAEET
jgi:hypothetical protein